MDQRLSKALEHANYVQSFKNKKRILEQKYQKDIMLYYKGHAFESTVSLVSFALNQSEPYWIVDSNNVPVYIDKVLDFYTKLKDTYNTATTSFGVEYEKMLKGKKSVQGILDV